MNPGNSNLRACLSLATGSVLAALCCPAALAQESMILEEIMVTAQRREENIQNVPITISAFSGEALQQFGARRLENVAALVSNTQVFDLVGSGMPVWFIRGTGIIDFNPNNTPTAAVYLDDVYQVSSVFGSIALFDVERVEVLKGPQGGLYGRNTSGGAVRVATREPSFDEATGEASVSADRWGRFIGDLGASLPLSDKLAVRLSAHVEQSDHGWQRTLSGERHGALDAYAVRGQLAFRSEGFDARLIVDAGSDDSQTPLVRSIGLYDATGAFCAPVLAGRLDDGVCLTLPQVSGDASADPSRQSQGAERVLADPFNRNNNDTFGATLIANAHLGSATLTSVTGYRSFDWRQLQDNDAIAGEWGHQVSGSFFETFSQELRLASNDEAALSWIVGASYADEKLSEHRPFLSSEHTVFGGPVSPTFDLFYDQTGTAWAAFGQLDYDLTDALTLSGSLRYSDEEKDYGNGNVFFAPVGLLYATPLSDHYDLSEHETGKLSLTWRLTPHSTLFGSISRGAKSGGFFGGYSFVGGPAIRPYREETVWSYEIGAKNVFAAGRLGLNVSAFVLQFDDVQGFSVEIDPLVGAHTRLDNLGKADHYGIEIEAFARPTERLHIGGGVGWLDAKLDSDRSYFTQDFQEAAFDGQRRQFAPEWSWNVYGSYDAPLASAAMLRFTADANGRSGLITDFGSLVDKAIQNTPGYTVVNARIGYLPADASWEIALYGRNMLDKTYSTIWGSDGLGNYFKVYGEPRNYGIEAMVRW